jgi:hypothetical protein
MEFAFKRLYSFNERREKSEFLRKENPNRVPVILFF